MVTYDVFQPMANISWPPFPIKAQILKPDGQFENVTFNNPREFLTEGVAIKFIRPDPVTEKVNEIANAINGRGFVGREIIREVVEYMLKDEQPKVDVNLPTVTAERAWLNTKLDKMGYNIHSVRERIADWYFNPDKHMTAPLQSNSILTVKKIGDFARVVVLPTGHTIAYSTAQKLWYAMNDRYLGYSFSNTTVGEYSSYGRIIHRKRRIDVDQFRVKVGCQTVDRDVIAEFAQRQGWSKTPPHGAY